MAASCPPNTRSPAPFLLVLLGARAGNAPHRRGFGLARGILGMPWLRHREGRGERDKRPCDERSEPASDCQVEPPETEHLSNRRTNPGPARSPPSCAVGASGGSDLSLPMLDYFGQSAAATGNVDPPFSTPPGAAYGVERYFSPNTISTRFLGCVRLLADYFWESLSMKKLATSIILPAMLSTALWAAPSFAGDMSAGSPGNGESPRGGATDQDYVYREAKPIAPKLEAGEESRAAPITDETAVINSLTAVGKIQRRQGPQGRGERGAQGDHQAAAQRSGRRRRRRQDLGPEEGGGPGLQDRRRSLAPGVRQRRPHPDRQYQGLSVHRDRLSRIEGREGQLRELLGDADRPVDGADGRALPLQPRGRRLAGGHVLRARPQRLDRRRRSVRRL